MTRRIILGYTFDIVESDETGRFVIYWVHRIRRPQGRPPQWVRRVHGTDHADPDDAFNHIVEQANGLLAVVA